MAGGEHEAVSVRPGGIARVVAQEPGPENVSRRGHAHRHSRMPRFRLLHGVHRQGSDRIDAEFVHVDFCRHLLTYLQSFISENPSHPR